MDIDWNIVVIGLACTCIGLWFGWGYYHGKVRLLRMEIKVLKGELTDEKSRGEACEKAADEWRGVAMRHAAEVDRLKHEKALVRKALAHKMLESGDTSGRWSPDYWKQVLEECEAELGSAEYRWRKRHWNGLKET